MKYTNIKKLLIKFMGGGLINFPTRFLRWIKIDGDAEGDDGGGGDSSSDVFFSPISTQPSYFASDSQHDEIKIVDIKDVTVDTLESGELLFSKESLVSIGVNEQGLNNLEQVSYSDTLDEDNESRGWRQNDLKDIIIQNNLIGYIEQGNDSFSIEKFTFSNKQYPIIFKIRDNIYKIAIFSFAS